tara:strand:- start:561 stop:797 length:237 start_codon:yes stop_codon:yes gene_type:complete
LKNFWPHRSKANGFSIQNLTRKYRLKILSQSSVEVSNQRLINNNINLKINQNKYSMVNLSIKRTHWANRDFSEYKDAA